MAEEISGHTLFISCVYFILMTDEVYKQL